MNFIVLVQGGWRHSKEAADQAGEDAADSSRCKRCSA